MMIYNIVLFSPEIPPNTGNIGRLSLGTNSSLNIVGSPGFDLDEETAVKRAGLDYWDRVNVGSYTDWANYQSSTSGSYYLVTKFAQKPYCNASYEPGDHLMFGGENHGAPDAVHEDEDVTKVCIPMLDGIRAYNLANSTAIVLFEALRQQNPEWFNKTPHSV
ncbi:MAG: tRNA (cytidine(34)-2'-O)-methyltransferase [bacterium]